MNRSKLFLGLTTALLAVAGIAAAKSGKFVKKAFGYYFTNTITNQCTIATTVQWYTKGNITAVTTNSELNITTPVYTQYQVGSCGGARLYQNHTD